MTHSDEQPTDWIAVAKDALAKGREYHRSAAEAISKALERMTQKSVALQIGRSPTWVCRVLKWYRAGCQSDTVFGPEAAERRERIATSQLDGLLTDEQLGQLSFDLKGGWSSYVPGQREATSKTIETVKALRNSSSWLGRLTADDLTLVLPNEPSERHRIITTLRRELNKASPLIADTLEMIRQLIGVPEPRPDDDDMADTMCYGGPEPDQVKSNERLDESSPVM